MSYTVLYDSTGIRFKRDDLYLTLSKQGCSNVFSGPNKRSREWSFWSPLGSKPFTKEAIIKDIEDYRLSLIERNKKNLAEYENWSTYTDSSFGYYASVAMYGKSPATTSYKQYYNYYVKEDSKCIWFEDFAASYAVYVELPWYCIPEALKDTVQPKRLYVKTEEELFNAIEYFSLNYIGMNFYINTSLPEYKTSKDVLNKLNPNALPQRVKRPKQRVEVDKFYTIMFEDNYFKKRTARSIVYSYYNPQVKLATEKQAIAKLNKVGKGDDRFSIKLINQAAVI